MNNAIWLFLALPDWYFSTVLDPFGASILSLVPAIGVISLFAGVALGVLRKNRGLLLFTIPFVLCEAFVAFAGFNRGQIEQITAQAILLVFVTIMGSISIWLVWRLKGVRLPALLLSVFSITYALFAAFVAGMSFANDWL